MIAASLVLAACGSASADVSSGDEFNSVDLASTLEDGINEQIDGADASVKCPKDVKFSKDDTFKCTFEDAAGEQDTGVITVTQTDDKGGIDWEITEVNGEGPP